MQGPFRRCQRKLQSAGQVSGVSSPSHTPLPHRATQSAAQVGVASPQSQTPSPQMPFVCTQPEPGKQPSCVHASPSAQESAGPDTHVPLTHVSLAVHALPSEQGGLSANATWLQPFVMSQPSAVQGLPSSQLFELPKHAPNRHMSSCVQASPSLQPRPLGLFGAMHVPVIQSQAYTWHCSFTTPVQGFSGGVPPSAQT